MNFQDFFSFTLQERRGIIVFFVLSFMVILAFNYWHYAEPQPPQLIKDYYFDSIEVVDADTLSVINKPLWEDQPKEAKKRQTFVFNPNEISYDSLLLLGFSKFSAQNLINYVAKGGKINSVQKFKSIYGIDVKLIEELDEFVIYPSKQEKLPTLSSNHEQPIKEETVKPVKIIELNIADSIELISLKGVGPYTAHKILVMRSKLGGFISIEQLTELKVMQDSMFQTVKNQLTVDPVKITRININTADYKTFTTHPYFTTQTANAILKYRNQHGPYQDVKHISRIRSISEETGLKIMPYLGLH